jgi:hypothetical protein
MPRRARPFLAGERIEDLGFDVQAGGLARHRQAFRRADVHGSADHERLTRRAIRACWHRKGSLSHTTRTQPEPHYRASGFVHWPRAVGPVGRMTTETDIRVQRKADIRTFAKASGCSRRVTVDCNLRHHDWPSASEHSLINTVGFHLQRPTVVEFVEVQRSQGPAQQVALYP